MRWSNASATGGSSRFAFGLPSARSSRPRSTTGSPRSSACRCCRPCRPIATVMRWPPWVGPGTARRRRSRPIPCSASMPARSAMWRGWRKTCARRGSSSSSHSAEIASALMLEQKSGYGSAVHRRIGDPRLRAGGGRQRARRGRAQAQIDGRIAAHRLRVLVADRLAGPAGRHTGSRRSGPRRSVGFAGVAAIVNATFADSLRVGEAACRLAPLQLLAAGAATAVVATLPAVLGGLAAARVQPSLELRNV